MWSRNVFTRVLYYLLMWAKEGRVEFSLLLVVSQSLCLQSSSWSHTLMKLSLTEWEHLCGRGAVQSVHKQWLTLCERLLLALIGYFCSGVANSCNATKSTRRSYRNLIFYRLFSCRLMYNWLDIITILASMIYTCLYICIILTYLFIDIFTKTSHTVQVSLHDILQHFATSQINVTVLHWNYWRQR